MGLHFLPYFTALGSVSASLIIPDWGALLAGATFAISFLLYLFLPKKHTMFFSLGVYLLLVATSGLLVMSTGNTHSSFIGLWLAVTVFASVFGVWGIVPLFLAVVTDVLYIVMKTSTLSFNDGIVIAIVGIAPLIASYIIFHVAPKKSNSSDNSLHKLASELNQVNNKADTVINAIDDGVIALNSKGDIDLINPAAQQIIGWGNADAIGLNYKSVLKLSDKESQALTDANDPISQVLVTGKDVHRKDLFATTGSGKRLLVSLVVTPIGQVGEGIIIVFRDITREAAEEREQAEFISTASHEMRTPVASIEGYLGLALNPNTAQIDAKARDFIEKAHASAQHLGRLFQDLLDVSKADDGRLSNHPKVVDVTAYLTDVIEGLRPKAEEKQLRLYYKPAPNSDDDSSSLDRNISPVFYANVDQDHLREVVANLTENAIKYTPKGDVIVDVTGDEDHVIISIQDSGIGIAREDIPHLFQKFYRVDSTATREIGGTGLGLYLCRRLAEVMGGRLWLESEFGKGSTFFLELPRLSREEATRMIDAASAQLEVQAESHASPFLPDTDSSATDGQATLMPAIEQAPTPQPVIQTAPLNTPAAPTVPTMPQPVAPAVLPPAAPVTSAAGPTLAAIEQNPSAYAQQAAQVRANELTVPSRSTGPISQ